MPIDIVNQFPSLKLENQSTIVRWIEKVIHDYGKQYGDITIILLTDQEIHRMNNQYLGHDYPTDVITFPYSDNDLIQGDIFIGIDTVMENSRFYESGFNLELNRVMIHGILHLLGYDDSTPREKSIMRQKEDHALTLINV